MKTKFLIPISIVIAGLFIAGAFVYVNQEGFSFFSKGQLSSAAAAEKAIQYINENKDEIAGGQAASLLNVVEENGIYKIHIKVGEGEYDSYVTKDGKFLFPSAYVMEEGSDGSTSGAEQSAPVEVVKTDVPDVKLFIMSYCPYGLQAQKMFLPVYDLLKDKADMGIYFVGYAMHEKQEIDENLNQYCIEKEQKDKYSSYLSCFVLSGDSGQCLSQSNVDKTELSNCISQTDQEYSIYSLYNDQSTWLSGTYPQFNVNADLNEQYGVQGSPTVVINDEVVNINPRSPENFKNIVCQAFNSTPEECNQTLSDEVPSAGIGGGTGSSSSGGCN